MEGSQGTSTLLDARSVWTLSDRPEFHSEARRLESRFKLTFFDSLHAAVSKVQKEIIVSSDDPTTSSARKESGGSTHRACRNPVTSTIRPEPLASLTEGGRSRL